MTNIKYKAERGFSMLEIMITLVVVAIALLGTAGMQAFAMKVGQGGQLRNQAVYLAADMAERIETNKPLSAASGVPGYEAIVPATVNCQANACTSAELGVRDVNNWNLQIARLLPSGQGTITRSVAGNLYTYTIVVSWLDRRTDVTYAAGAGSAVAGVSGGEDVTVAGGTKLSVTTTRVIRGI
ncbi:MAG: type IV pilus modification protein PilV [Gallionella sp.]